MSPRPTQVYIPVPLQPTDFPTHGAWLPSATEDEPTPRRVTDSTVTVRGQPVAWSWEVLPEVRDIPAIAVSSTRWPGRAVAG